MRTIDEIPLVKPLFYCNELGLRFEIGPENDSIWKGMYKRGLNHNYFEKAYHRAQMIFNSAFEVGDDISLVYQKYAPGRKKIKRQNFLAHSIRNYSTKPRRVSQLPDLYGDELVKKNCWKRLRIDSLDIEDIDSCRLLRGMINSDFKIRGFSISGELYFLNHTKQLILNLYDDRGMDIVGLKLSFLRKIYYAHKDKILPYDKDRIEQVFDT